MCIGKIGVHNTEIKYALTGKKILKTAPNTIFKISKAD